MKKKTKAACTGFYLVILLSLFSPAMAGYNIILKSGGIIKTDTYFEDEDMVTYRQFGETISIGRDAVKEIREQKQSIQQYDQVVPDEDLFKDTGANDNPSNERTAPRKKSRGKAKSLGGESTASGKYKSKSIHKNAGAKYFWSEYHRYKGMQKMHCGKEDYKSKELCTDAKIGFDVTKKALKAMGQGLPPE